MKAKLIFNLDEPEDKMAHLRCVKALDMALALWQISQAFRESLKWGNLEGPVYEAVEKGQDNFYKVLAEYGIELDELIS